MASVTTCSTVLAFNFHVIPQLLFFIQVNGRVSAKREHRGSHRDQAQNGKKENLLWAAADAVGHVPSLWSQAPSVPFAAFEGPQGHKPPGCRQSPRAAGHRQPPAHCHLLTLPHGPAQKQLFPTAVEGLKLQNVKVCLPCRLRAELEPHVLLPRSQLPDKPLHPRNLAGESSLEHVAIGVMIIIMRPASLS